MCIELIQFEAELLHLILFPVMAELKKRESMCTDFCSFKFTPCFSPRGPIWRSP
jgi:hypothetical protein